MFTSALKSFTSNITSNYAVSSMPTSAAGAWKIYDGKKKSNGKAVSIFIFDRKALESLSSGLGGRSGASGTKRIYDEIIERLKKEASSLARLRHPNILELAEPVEDTRNGGLMFATEPVTASLSSLLKDGSDCGRFRDDNDLSRRRKNGEGEDEDTVIKKVELDELEIQKGLLQVAKGLEFLHESAGLVHGNLTPDAVYINAKSDWKLSGLGFSGSPDSSATNTAPPIALSELLYHDPRIPSTVQLNLDFTSPDFALDSNISSAADMFSLGLVLVTLYNSPHESPIRTNGNLSSYKKSFSSSSTTPSSNNNFLSSRPLPRQLLTEVLPRLITRRPAQRMNAREFQQSAFFDNIMVSTIRFLESLPAKTPNEKSQFMRGLPRILDQFPKSVLDKKILPALLEEMKDRDLLALILQNVFKILRTSASAKRSFTDKVVPRLREIFILGSKNGPQERDTRKEAGLVIILENAGFTAELCSGKEFKDEIVPLIQIGLESPTHSIVDKALGCVSTILGSVSFTTVKHDIFPAVATVFSKTSSLAIKIRGLEAFVVLCGGSTENALSTGDDLDGSNNGLEKSKSSHNAALDKFTVQEKIVPLLKAIKTKEPAVMMAALAVFKQVGMIADSEFLATDVLPTLWNFSLGPLLNLQQFKDFMDLVRIISARIEQDQTRKLQELSSTSTNGLSASTNNGGIEKGSSGNAYPTSNGTEYDFERLVLGSKSQGMVVGNVEPQSQKAQASHHSSSSTNPWSAQSAPDGLAGAMLPQQKPFSRAITPDQTLSSFAALQPSISSSIPQGIASGASTNISTGWGSMESTQSMKPAASTSAWSSSPYVGPGGLSKKPTLTEGPSNPAFNQSSAPTNKPSFLIAPPPNIVKPYSEVKKQGLDAYESLI